MKDVAGGGATRAGSTRGIIWLRELLTEEGLHLPEVRRLAATDKTFPPITWTGPRSGWIFREDWEKWKAERHERRDRSRQQGERALSFIRGRGINPRSKNLPPWLRGK